MAEGGAVSEICVSNRLSGKKKNNNNNNNNKDSTEIRKTIKDSNVLESFNESVQEQSSLGVALPYHDMGVVTTLGALYIFHTM